MSQRHDHHWYLCTNDIVSGPFSTEQIRSRLEAGSLRPGSFVWTKGQREWLPIDHWEANLDEIQKALTAKSDRHVWYVELRAGQEPMGPLTHSEMIDQLKHLDKVTHVKLWAVGMTNWLSLFEMPEVMEEIGVSRRRNERAPLMGSVMVSRTSADHRSTIMKAATVSIEGMGLIGEHDLHRGDEVMLVIRSSSLPMPIHLSGQVAYVLAQGHVGLHFVNAQPEAQSVLLDYVKRFNGGELKANAA